MAHYGHLENHLCKCDRIFLECPQYIYSISAMCSSLTCRKVMLTVRSGCWEPCTCCPDRDQSRSSPGRVREMCEVCVQRHCCAVHLAALLRAHRNKKQSRFPRVGPQSQAQGCEPAHEASLGRSDLTAAVSLPSASPCGCAALQLG